MPDEKVNSDVTVKNRYKRKRKTYRLTARTNLHSAKTEKFHTQLKTASLDRQKALKCRY
ncbi:MAG: hypothetical protein L6V93_04640 [Clostridiales bacterium]|nr:MAG: hypothetical protein L6V93_04640 [Clostridiales bacterium]